PGAASGPGLAAQGVAGLDAGQDGLEPVGPETPEVRLRQEGEAALRGEVDAARRDDLLDGGHDLVEADPEVGIVPGHPGALQLPEEELQVLLDLGGVEGLVVDRVVDAAA